MCCLLYFFGNRNFGNWANVVQVFRLVTGVVPPHHSCMNLESRVFEGITTVDS
jgi:hypothetical protein